MGKKIKAKLWPSSKRLDFSLDYNRIVWEKRENIGICHNSKVKYYFLKLLFLVQVPMCVFMYLSNIEHISYCEL